MTHLAMTHSHSTSKSQSASSRSVRLARFGALAPALVVLLGALPAFAADRPAYCAKFYSLLNPMPRECLDPIDTDRPHLADTAHTIDPGYFVLETELAAYVAPRGGAYPTTRSIHAMLMLAKLGLITGVDLQVGYNALGVLWDDDGMRAQAGDELFLRLKVNLFGGNRGRVSLTVTPVFLVSLTGDGLDGGGLALLAVSLPRDFELELNLALMSQGDEVGRNHFTTIPAVAVTRELIPRLSLFGEFYAEAWRADSKAQWHGIFASGLLYLLSHDWQLDGGFRVGLNDRVAPYELFLGVSFRL